MHRRRPAETGLLDCPAERGGGVAVDEDAGALGGRIKVDAPACTLNRGVNEGLLGNRAVRVLGRGIFDLMDGLRGLLDRRGKQGGDGRRGE